MTTPRMLSKRTFPFIISKRFQQAVALHILKNMLKVDVQVPLLMGIHGPTGEGKTFQCETILKQMGVKRFLISGGQFDSQTPGQASIVRSTYIRASDALVGGECSMAVVLINDIDTGLGSWGDSTRYTVNQQTVFGDLMHLVDYPNSVEGKDTRRVPIIITGNDFTKLYEPLVRAGRMAAFEWIPSLDERAEIVSSIYPELKKEQCRDLILALNEKFDDQLPPETRSLSVAFFAHLRSTLLDEDLWQEIEQAGLYNIVDEVVYGKDRDYSIKISYERVLSKGIELAQSGHLVNHFRFTGD